MERLKQGDVPTLRYETPRATRQPIVAVHRVIRRRLETSGRRFTRRSADLTEGEREVLAELAAGLTTDEVAEALHVSPHTVRSRLKTALRKVGAKTREQAVAIAIREGAIDLEL